MSRLANIIERYLTDKALPSDAREGAVYNYPSFHPAGSSLAPPPMEEEEGCAVEDGLPLPGGSVSTVGVEHLDMQMVDHSALQFSIAL